MPDLDPYVNLCLLNMQHLLFCVRKTNAITTSYTLPLIKAPVGRLRNWLDLLAHGVKFAAGLSARAWYHVIRSALNNPITRRITPSVTSLDSKVEYLCDTAGRYTGNALAFPVILSFYLIASAYALAVSALVIPLYTVVSTVTLVASTYTMTCHLISKVVHDLKENFNERTHWAQMPGVLQHYRLIL